MMKLASSETRKATKLAISAGVPIRPSGWTARTLASAAAGSGCLSNHSWTRAVRVHPGQTALTRMPRGHWSSAKLRVRPTRPDFAAAYGNIPSIVIKA